MNDDNYFGLCPHCSSDIELLIAVCKELQVRWRREVAAGETSLGYYEWEEREREKASGNPVGSFACGGRNRRRG
jgi:hypothetical protein